MRYPDNFVAAVKAEYPDWDDLHRALDRGSQMVGRYLDDSQRTASSWEALILTATNLAVLQEEARREQRRRALYHQWIGTKIASPA